MSKLFEEIKLRMTDKYMTLQKYEASLANEKYKRKQYLPIKLATLFFMVMILARMQENRHLPSISGDENWYHRSGNQFGNMDEEP